MDQSIAMGSRSIQELQTAKESRASDTLKMKDEQIRILTEQNNKLLASLDKTEEELSTFQLEKLTIEEENRTLRQSNFELQTRSKSAEGQLADIKSAHEDLESQMSTMTSKNTELFNLLQAEEANMTKVKQELEQCKTDLTTMHQKYTDLVQSAKDAQNAADNASRENTLKTEEIRVLRMEVDQLKQKNTELHNHTTVELEAANEQLRLRKEKQYQLLGKLQSQEENSRQAEDHAKELEQCVQDLRRKNSELQTALQLETNSRISQVNSNRTMSIDLQSISAENKELSSKLNELEQDRLKLEAESRDNGDQLREMAEKVFQLLERLKLVELGKKKSTEALAKKEQELFTVKKLQNKMTEDVVDMKRIRERVEAEKRDLEDQLRGLKKVNTQLGHKLKEEAKMRLKEEEACKEANEKIHTLDGRLAFLLNRLQTDEEAKSVQQGELKKMESQVQIMVQKCDALQTKLSDSETSNREANDKLNQAEQQLKESKIKLDSMEQALQMQEDKALHAERKAIQMKEGNNNEQHHLAGGQLRFFVDNRPSLGYLVIAGKTPKDKAWMEEKGCNVFLRKVTKSQNAAESLTKKIAELYGIIVSGEEKTEKALSEVKAREEDLARMEREVNKMQGLVCSEEESKRRILLRYMRAVKASASLGEPGCEEDRNEVGRVGAGRIHLPEVRLVMLLMLFSLYMPLISVFTTISSQDWVMKRFT
jgi:chromosome segregation ATPase